MKFKCENSAEKYKDLKYVIGCKNCGKPIFGSDKPIKLSQGFIEILKSTPCSACDKKLSIDLSGYEVPEEFHEDIIKNITED